MLLHRATRHRLGEAHTLAVLAGLPDRSGDTDHWTRAAELFAELGPVPLPSPWHLLTGAHRT